MNIHWLIFFLIPCCCSGQVKTYTRALDECDLKMQEISKDPSQGVYNPYPYCLLGAKLPSFKAYTLNKRKIDSAYFLGKITVLNFWLTTCPPCKAEIPGFNQLREKYKNKKVNFLAIGRNSEHDIREFLSIHPWDFDLISNDENIFDTVFKFRCGYPITFIVDKKMKIVEIIHGGVSDTSAITTIQNKIIPVLERELSK